MTLPHRGQGTGRGRGRCRERPFRQLGLRAAFSQELPRGAPIKSFRGAWQTACDAAGVPSRIFHDFRRTAVRNLERAGVSRSVAMKLTGHKTEAVYRGYAIVNDADLRAAADKLAAIEHRPDPGTGTITGTVTRIGGR